MADPVSYYVIGTSPDSLVFNYRDDPYNNDTIKELRLYETLFAAGQDARKLVIDNKCDYMVYKLQEVELNRLISSIEIIDRTKKPPVGGL